MKIKPGFFHFYFILLLLVFFFFGSFLFTSVCRFMGWILNFGFLVERFLMMGFAVFIFSMQGQGIGSEGPLQGELASSLFVLKNASLICL